MHYQRIHFTTDLKDNHYSFVLSEREYLSCSLVVERACLSVSVVYSFRHAHRKCHSIWKVLRISQTVEDRVVLKGPNTDPFFVAFIT